MTMREVPEQELTLDHCYSPLRSDGPAEGSGVFSDYEWGWGGDGGSRRSPGTELSKLHRVRSEEEA